MSFLSSVGCVSHDSVLSLVAFGCQENVAGWVLWIWGRNYLGGGGWKILMAFV